MIITLTKLVLCNMCVTSYVTFFLFLKDLI